MPPAWYLAGIVLIILVFAYLNKHRYGIFRQKDKIEETISVLESRLGEYKEMSPERAPLEGVTFEQYRLISKLEELKICRDLLDSQIKRERSRSDAERETSGLVPQAMTAISDLIESVFSMFKR